MEKQFKLTLTNRWKATVLVLGIVAATLPMLMGILIAFEQSKLLGVIAGIIGLAAFVMLPERVAKYFSAEYATVAFDPTGITVIYAATGEMRRLDFAEVSSYYEGLAFDFTIRPRRGKPLVFHLNEKLHPQGTGELLALQRHFAVAASQYNQNHFTVPSGIMPQVGEASAAACYSEKRLVAPIRRLGFVSQPAGTFWFMALTGLTVWLGWRASQPGASEGAWGGFIFIGLALVVYASVWWHERQNPG